MIARCLIFSFAVLVINVPVHAANLSGMKLYEYCAATNGSAGGLACTEYVQGFVAGIEAGDGSKIKDKRIWCFTEGATVGQARLIIEKYMRDNPQMLDRDAATIAGKALLLAFPCK